MLPLFGPEITSGGFRRAVAIAMSSRSSRCFGASCGPRLRSPSYISGSRVSPPHADWSTLAPSCGETSSGITKSWCCSELRCVSTANAWRSRCPWTESERARHSAHVFTSVQRARYTRNTSQFTVDYSNRQSWDADVPAADSLEGIKHYFTMSSC